MFILQSLHLSPCLLFPFIIWLQTSHEVMFLKVYSANWWLVSRTGGGSTLTLKISNFKNQNDSRDQLDHSVHLLNIKIKTRRKKDNYFNSDTRRASFLDDHWHGRTPVTKSYHSPPSGPSPRPGSAPGCCSAGCPSHSWKRSPTCFWFVRSLWHWNR